MRTAFQIAQNDLRLFLIDRGNLIGLLAVPVVMTLIIGFVNGGFFDNGPSSLRIDILDLDNSLLSAQLLDSIREANSSLILCPMENDADDVCRLGGEPGMDQVRALSRVADTVTLAAVEIPAGFEESVRAFRTVEIRYWSLEALNAPGYIQQAIEAAIQRVNGAAVASRVGSGVAEKFGVSELDPSIQAGFKIALYERAAALWQINPIGVKYELSAQVEERTVTKTLQNGLGQSVPGMGGTFVMFTVFGGMTALVIERKQGTLQRLAVMPLSRAQLLGGKILARFTLGLIQYLVVFAVGLVVGMNFGDDLLALTLLIVTYTLAVTALSFAVGTRLENEAQASGLSLLLSMVLAPLGGAWWPLEIVPDFMRFIGHVSPVAWAMDGFNTLIFESGGLAETLLPIGVLSALTIGSFVIGVWRFRVD